VTLDALAALRQAGRPSPKSRDDQSGQQSREMATNDAPKPKFGILGPLQVLQHGIPVDIGPRKQQIVLAALLCNANSVVPVSSLIDALWDEVPPRTARKNVQVYVSALRGLAGQRHPCAGSHISHQLHGYVFHAQPSELDSLGFEQRARSRQSLRNGGQPAAVAGELSRALDLWRGPVLDGMRDIPLIAAAAHRLEQQFLAVFEDWAEAEIAAGAATGSVDRIAEIAQRHPLRERLRILQMTALCHAGRGPEAMAVYDELRQLLAHDLGLSPSPALTRYYESLLSEQTAVLLPSLEARPSLLPWDLPTFTGQAERQRELAEAITGGASRLAVVTGPLGVGKTAFAVHVAHQVKDRFPDGCFLIRLRTEGGRPRSLAEIVSELGWAGRHGARDESPASARSAWQRWLSGHRMLLILDDARHEREVRPLLPDDGHSVVIVTARPRLAGLEAAHRLCVPPLTLAEALELLGRIIGAGRVAADQRSAERLVMAAGLLPLGVRILGERLAMLRHVPLREYAARLAAAAALLDELAAGDLAMRPRLDEAVRDLPEQASLALPQLGRLPDAVFTLEQAAEALNADQVTTIRVLETLLEAGVILTPGIETLAHSVQYELPALTYAWAREAAEGR
jgi:DNA-binding SARP family transcriptional activator